MSMKKQVLGGFVVGLVTIALAATAFASGAPAGGGSTPAPTISPTVIQITPESPCPDGWHLVPNTVSGDQFACVPTKTTQMIECPPGLVYYDNGCNIGCEVPVK